MRWQKRQEHIEEQVYDAISELEDILGIELAYYPEVFWLGKKLKFQDLHLPKSYEDDFEIRTARGISYYIPRHRLVIISLRNQEHSLLEESAHAFHFAASDISYRGRSLHDALMLECLSELMAMLGARLLGSELVNPFENFPDLLVLDRPTQKKVREALTKIFGESFDYEQFLVHQQGYGLANRIYWQYLRGQVSTGFLRRLFLSKFDEPDGAIKAVVELRNKFWTQRESLNKLKHLKAD